MYRGDIQKSYPNVFSPRSRIFSRAKFREKDPAMKGFILGILFAALLDYTMIVDASEYIIIVLLVLQTLTDWIATL